ncbi:MAG: hypothetical protein LAT75_10965 [Candidatus Cyclonatronum sp.]|uniref:hypothetical protein n=1 Tax=Cyclonatronum sp. TaxID=3024185 RepID=UPI0025C1EE1B|nr:hypothetical protein [Cyclonatronum sp.]MCC5934572.1 hypothetical protein [Balneolales bacterium]MCH8487375.1 hypothetical protein [Cyclonatronum sp.]
MNYKKDFLHGMGSAFDLHGNNFFNDFDQYPGAQDSIDSYWGKAAYYIRSSVTKFTSESHAAGQNADISSASFRDKGKSLRK